MSLLEQPLITKRLSLKNRLVLPPMASGRADENGNVTDELIHYYTNKTVGGCLGLMITEHSYISPDGKAQPRQLSLADDDKIEGLSRLTAAVHKKGCPIVAQINHAGGATTEQITGMPTFSPSGIPFGNRKGGTRIMAQNEISAVTRSYAQAALRAKEAGFDGVEIHSAHGYLLNQFASPFTNRRTDEYGKTLEGRLKIHREVISAVRQAVGDGFPVFLRLGACDYMDGGSTFEDGAEMAVQLSQTDIDFLDISGGLNGYIVPGREKEQGYFSDLTSAIRKRVPQPVILTGGITKPSAAEQLLREGAADLIGVGRAMLKDPAWAASAFAELSGIS